MRRHVLIILGLLICAVPFVAAQDSANSEQEISPYTLSVGLDLPNLGLSIETNDRGQIVAARGINFSLGYSAKHYFSPVEFGEFNGYWHWGTVALVFPYIGIGADYVLESGLYVGVGTFYFAPYLSVGVYLD